MGQRRLLELASVAVGATHSIDMEGESMGERLELSRVGQGVAKLNFRFQLVFKFSRLSVNKIARK